MITDKLFDRVLIEPAIQHKADELYVVSGYATPGLADQHFHALKEHAPQLKVNISVIHGMSRKEGVLRSSHNGFIDLVKKRYKGRLTYAYVINGPPVHSKIYVWMHKKQPCAAFAGSANYTLSGFGKRQNEVLVNADPETALAYWKRTNENAMLCTSPDVEGQVNLDKQPEKKGEKTQTVKLSLLDKKGNTHRHAGLNWGQRPKRNRNQAYIPIPISVHRKKFFPPLKEHFTVQTDDGQIMICVVAQEGGQSH